MGNNDKDKLSQDIIALLDQHPQRVAVVLGEAGSGKTELCKQLIALINNRGLATPIYVPVRETKSFDEFLTKQNLTLNGKYIFFLDGFGENERLENIFSCVQLKKYNAQFVITCRSLLVSQCTDENVYFAPLKRGAFQKQLISKFTLAAPVVPFKNFSADIVKQCTLFCHELAKAMQKANAVEFHCPPISRLFAVNNPLEKAQRELSPWALSCCPLVSSGKYRYRFTDNKLIAYFANIQLATEEKQPAVKLPSIKPTSTTQQHFLNLRLITADQGMRSMLADRVKENNTFRELLFKMLLASRDDAQVEVAAANAITILNDSKVVSFADLNLSRVRISGADVSGGNFDHGNLLGIIARRVRFANACLREADMRYADLTEADFGFKQISNLDLGPPQNGMLDGHTDLRSKYNSVTNLIAINHRDTVHLWNLSTGVLVKKITPTNIERINDVVWVNNGMHIAVYGELKGKNEYPKKNLVELWRMTDYQLFHQWQSPNSIEGITTPNQASNILIISIESPTRNKNYDEDFREQRYLEFWRCDRLVSKLNSLPLAEIADQIKYHPGGNILISPTLTSDPMSSPDQYGDLNFYDIASCKHLLTLPGKSIGSDIINFVFSPMGDHLVTAHHSGKITIFSCNAILQFKVLAIIPNLHNISDVIFNPQGTLFAVICGKQITLYQTSSGQLIQRYIAHAAPVIVISFDESGKRLASGGNDHKVIMWSIESDQPTATFALHSSTVDTLIFINETLFSADKSGVSFIWPTTLATSNKENAQQHLSSKPVGMISAQPIVTKHANEDVICAGNTTVKQRYHSKDNQYLALICSEETTLLQVWNIVNKKLLFTKENPKGEITAVTITQQNKVIIGDEHGSLRCWDIASSNLEYEYHGDDQPILRFDCGSTGEYVTYLLKEKCLSSVVFFNPKTCRSPFHYSFTSNPKDVHFVWNTAADLFVCGGSTRNEDFRPFVVYWDRASLTSREMQGMTYYPADMYFVPNTNQLVLTDQLGNQDIWEYRPSVFDGEWRHIWSSTTRFQMQGCLLANSVGLSASTMQTLTGGRFQAATYANWHTLHYRVAAGDMIEVTQCLDTHPKTIDVTGKNNITALLIAVQKDNLPMVKLLLARGANVHMRDDSGRTALHIAAQYNRPDIARYLLSKEAAQFVLHKQPEAADLQKYQRKLLSSLDNLHHTPLYKAVAKDRNTVARVFIFETDPTVSATIINDCDSEGENLLLESARRANDEALTMLLEKKTQHRPNKQRATTLHYAVIGGANSTVEVLLQADQKSGRTSDVNTQDEDGYCPLHHAANSGQVKKMDLLLRASANLQLKTRIPQATPLHLAAASGHENAVMFLLDNKADIDALNSLKLTPIQEAVCEGKLLTVTTFLQHDRYKNRIADPQFQMDLLNAYIKLKNCDHRMLQLLLRFGIGKHLKDFQWSFALKVFIEKARIEEIVLWLSAFPQFTPSEYVIEAITGNDFLRFENDQPKREQLRKKIWHLVFENRPTIATAEFLQSVRSTLLQQQPQKPTKLSIQLVSGEFAENDEKDQKQPAKLISHIP